VQSPCLAACRGFDKSYQGKFKERCYGKAEELAAERIVHQTAGGYGNFDESTPYGKIILKDEW